MTCRQCEGPMKTARENFKYDAVGLPVTLVNVKVSRCRACGEYEVHIPRLTQLHALIAKAVTEKRGRLAPAEIKFLRTYLGWSGVEFAHQMGATAETISRWEHGATPMGEIADRLLRVLVRLAIAEPLGTTVPTTVLHTTIDLLKHLKAETAKPVRVSVKASRDGWAMAA